jgi:hypothetical protein
MEFSTGVARVSLYGYTVLTVPQDILFICAQAYTVRPCVTVGPLQNFSFK